MNESAWYSSRKTLLYSFLFAIGFHAALFAFVRRFPAFGELKPAVPKKLTVHLCARTPAKAPVDVEKFKPACFFPAVPPPPKKAVHKKPRRVPKPKPVKKPRKKVVKKVVPRVEKRVVPAPPPQPDARSREVDASRLEQKVESPAPPTVAPSLTTSPKRKVEATADKGPPAPPKRELAYPDYGKSPALTYPYLARRRGIEGRVILKVLVSRSGRPLKVVLEKSSGSSILDKAAVKAVRGWVFTPGKVNGTPAEMWVRVPVTYRLK